MHLNAQRPVFVPHEHVAELDKISKAALMDIVWDLSAIIVGAEDATMIMPEIRKVRDVVLIHRKQAKGDAP